jgi:hypothetical protein
MLVRFVEVHVVVFLALEEVVGDVSKHVYL